MRLRTPEPLRFGPCVSFGCEGIRLGPAQPAEPTQEELDQITAAILRLKEKRMATKMRAKLTIESVTVYEHSEQVKFRALYSNNHEDNTYAAATPSGEASLSITNKALHGQFKPGQKFYVDFTPAE